MQVNITGLHLEITEALRDYVEEKFERIERHFDRIIAVQVILQVEKLRQKAEATLHVAGREVVANAEHEDMYAAILQYLAFLKAELVCFAKKQR